ncbi:MAG: tubulin-like doman-containing protein, partial [Longimicrobiales bacterium]
MAELKLENIYPTLFIGLGGAGGHVLSRLNRLFERDFGEETRELDASPLQFLLLDTDDFEKLPQEVRGNLGNRERNFLSLSHFNPRRYAEGQLAFKDSDLHRWFDPRVLPFLEDAIIHDGASRLRMLGRLCLHHRYHEVEQRVRQKFEEAMDAKVHAAAQRIKPEPRPFRVFIVTSSCGGTGSALFVDIACIVNRIVRDRGTTPDVQGFVFLPFPFIEANAQIDPALENFYQHNAWAFFEELNYLLRHPEQLPNAALDPGRSYGDPPRPFEYGRDLLRTIYLVGHQIPPVGTLDLGDPLYSYVAHGIYHVFLTPEEGRIQSSYSNIKTKLQEPDRSFRYVKRFATFGYSEYRLAPQRYADRMGRMLVERERRVLLGTEPHVNDVVRTVDELQQHVDRYITSERDAARTWGPQLPIASGIVNDDSTQEIARAIQDLPSIGARDLDRKWKQLAERGIAQAVRTRIESALDKRFAALRDGLHLEQRVVERFRQQIIALADRLTSAVAQPPLDVDPIIGERVRRFARDAGELDQRLWGVGPLRRDRTRAQLLENQVAGLSSEIAEGARLRLIVELDRQIGLALRAVAEGQWLADLAARIGRSLAALDQPLRWADEDDIRESPTIQQIPPDAMLDRAALHDRADECQRAHSEALEPRRRVLWQELQSRIAREAGALDDFYKGLYREWARHATEAVPGVEELLRAWDEWRARHENGSEDRQPDVDGNALKRLMPMADPACPINDDRLHKQDTIPRITVAVGRFKNVDDARAQLGASGAFDLIDNGGYRFAVLQTRYAFSSRAIEGMETLHRSYLDRDPTISMPHVHVEWNERGLEDAAVHAVPFSPAECRHIVRALALGELANGVLDGTPAPGLRIETDDHDEDPFYLLRYRQEDGWPVLHWRD